MIKKKPILFILGNGYVAKHLNQLFKPLNWTIFHTSRQMLPNTIETQQAGHQLIHFDHPKVKQYLHQADAILSTIPPNTTEIDPVLSTYIDSLKNSTSPWIGYLSSTGVYGDHQGQWVQESSLCTPLDTTHIKRFAAEKAWYDLYTYYQIPIHVFRISGIYGPGRNALQDIHHGKSFTVYKPDHFFSRTYIDDLCYALLQSILQHTPGEIYNIADDLPCPLHTVHHFACQLLQRPPLTSYTLDEAPISQRACEFFAANKKISNQKIKTKLNIQWKYASYKEGLQHIFNTDFHIEKTHVNT
ncbi:MAG: SDR family NAD(P)-dependent oxidoreductase [Endozoicomonadaceae bacterium]|nr:SDR family NAD(P)-dependent oxidoreductase [Endozoicomonadaceae bacterium]